MTSGWTTSAVEEGQELVDRHAEGRASAEDLWRLLVLAGRAGFARERSEAVTKFLTRVDAILPELGAISPFRSDVEIINMLDAALESGDREEILDALMVVDDRVSARCALRQWGASRRTLNEAVALVVLSPATLIPQSRLAAARLAHLAEGAMTATLWRAVAQSPVLSAAAGRPSAAVALDLAVERIAREIAPRRIRLSVELRAASAEHRAPAHQTGDGWELNEEGGQLVLQVLFGQGEAIPATLKLRSAEPTRRVNELATRIGQEPGIGYYAIGSRESLLRLSSGGPLELELELGEVDGTTER